MSKASEWSAMYSQRAIKLKEEAEQLKRLRTGESPSFKSSFGVMREIRRIAEVDVDGSLRLVGCNLSQGEAVRLGKWLLDVFGD